MQSNRGFRSPCLSNPLVGPVIWLLGSLIPALSAETGSLATDEPPEFGWMDIDQLGQVKISSVSRKAEPAWQTAAAIHIIPQEEIRRSGVPSIPEALRLAPGVQVNQINSHRYAISVRGFNSEFANKLLVLMDGRSLYTPQFSGTLWDVQDTFMEDIDRIEVVRGPGGTAWGANAVNGVVNIVTKSAKDTQGMLVTGGGGTEERGFGGVRYGGQINETTYYRVYGKAFSRDETVFANGESAHDDWWQSRGGFRIDSTPNAPNTLTLQGDVYGGEATQLFLGARDDILVLGGNIIGRWGHSFSADSDLMLQAYYDGARRDSRQGVADGDTYDFDAGHRFQLGSRQEVNWGANYRLRQDQFDGQPVLTVIPERSTLHLFSLFLQDELTLVEDRLKLSAGSKFEYNDYTQWEFMPNGRLTWTPAQRHTVWASVGRAVRIPSRSDNDSTVNLPGPPAIQLLPNEALESEELLAFELGYRVQPMQPLSFDLAAFYNDYEHLRSRSPTTIGPTTLIRSDDMRGESYGGEIVATWQTLAWWRLKGSYSLLQLQLHPAAGNTDATSEAAEGDSPHHQFYVRSSMDFGKRVEFDATVRYSDSLPNLNVPAYVELDLRLAWRITRNLELALVGRNLLDAQHPEFRNTSVVPPSSQIQRGGFAKMTWTF